ncbi:MAG: hypothetical protein ACK5V8_05625 [Betaproteobacteria bacterium]
MNQRNRFPARRRFLKQSAALSASASLAAPAAVLAQVGPGLQTGLQIGLLHDVGGALGDATLGRNGRAAALLALRAASRSGAAIEPVLGDGVRHAAAMQARGIGLLVLQAPAAVCAQALEQLPPAASAWVLTPAALAAAPADDTLHGLAGRTAPEQRPAVLSSYAAVRVAALALRQAQERPLAGVLPEALPGLLPEALPGLLPVHGAQRLTPAELAARRGLQTLIVVAA